MGLNPFRHRHRDDNDDDEEGGGGSNRPVLGVGEFVLLP